MIDVRARDRIQIERHDWISQVLTLIWLHPWLDVAAGRKSERTQRECNDRELPRTWDKTVKLFVLVRLLTVTYSFSSARI